MEKLQWNELFDREHKPTEVQIKEFVSTPLFDSLDAHLRQTYNVKPKVEYSSCAMDGGMWRGWNIKYKKSGKSLCTLYPKQGYLLLLMAINTRQMDEAELLIPTCSEYVKELWEQSEVVHGAKYLGIEVRDDAVLRDVQLLIEIRVKTK